MSGSLAPAAGERFAALLVIEKTGLAEGHDHARVLLVLVQRPLVAQTFEHHILDRLSGREHRILRNVPDPHAFAHGARTGIGLLDAGNDFEERRFAGAIRPNQPDVIAVRDGKRKPFEQRPRAVGFGQCFAGKKNTHR
jgi:hypothetical protein